MRAGKALYDENLRLLVEKTKQNVRSVWRVCMDDKGIIVHMIKCRKIERPKPNSFLFITNDDSKPPKFGSFNGLSGYQLNIAGRLTLNSFSIKCCRLFRPLTRSDSLQRFYRRILPSC